MNHKGRSRHFTSPEELEQERKAEEAKRWRKKKQQDDDDEESGSEEGSQNEESESEEESDEDTGRGGVHSLIEIENPNRVQKKATQKVSKIDEASSSSPPAPVELSRREREEIERQKRAANYQKAHAEGKTEQARADLARLAIIRQQREEAAKLREQKKKEEEAKKGGK